MARSRSSPPSSYSRTALVLKKRDAEVAEGATVRGRTLGMILEETSLLRAREVAIELILAESTKRGKKFERAFCDCYGFLAKDETAVSGELLFIRGSGRSEN